MVPFGFYAFRLLKLPVFGKRRLHSSGAEKRGAEHMKKVSVRFEPDPSLNGIEVLIRAPERDDSVSELIDRISGDRSGALNVFDGYGAIRTIRTREIISVSSGGKLTSVVTADGGWFTRKTLQWLEAELDPQIFVRISRFEIINIEKVERYDFTIAGTLRIELAGGIETWASRRCIPAIRRRLTGKERK